ncbi:hypothetical protein BUALT_Bualt05G0076900 [Buddleja alternifolia]|uniref:C2H2-type domain-containing protein n=1 Tax=Buddleja alternifolia TaxID=168488 RepID=A0AAV6XIX7_9LAMI|nr:hypothetical protein BUALT_Bualt05G0076900 [Buddleja alternifolia]
MECKLCLKKFSNGKALGGHMRSHYAALPLPPNSLYHQQLTTDESTWKPPLVSISSSSSSYGSKQKRKNKCMRLVDIDPNIFNAAASVHESESTRLNKALKLMSFEDEQVIKRGKPSSSLGGCSVVFSTEEEVALCLIMLSKDVWDTELRMSRKVYKCEECNKLFKSSQGLGSHRSSHYNHTNKKKKKKKKSMNNNYYYSQVHDCPFCGKIFTSAQAVGGHKRSHFLASKFDEGKIDSYVCVSMCMHVCMCALDMSWGMNRISSVQTIKVSLSSSACVCLEVCRRVEFFVTSNVEINEQNIL